jgi:hypothetical protein
MGKKLILGTLAGTIAGMVFSMAIFMGLMGDMADQWMKDNEGCVKEMSMAWWVIGSVVISLFLTILLIKFRTTTFKGGAIAGTWITFFVVLWFAILSVSTYTAYPLEWMPIDVLVSTLTGTLSGGAISWVLGKVKE